MRTAVRFAIAAAFSLSLPAFASPVFTYKPAPDEERPVISELRATTQGSDLSLEVNFDRAPFGTGCKTRCANATLFVDTDNNPKTGAQFGKRTPETGADVAIVLQGVNEYRADEAIPYFRVKVRPLPNGATTLDDSAPQIDLDHRKNKDRVSVDAETAFVLVDASEVNVKWGKEMRIVYHPPASKAVSGKAPGFSSKKRGKVEILEGVEKKKKGRN